MTVVAGHLYRNGRRVERVPLDRPVTCAADRSEFIWIGLAEPTEEELRTLQENFHLHPLSVEDALQPHQLPKIDVYGDQLFVVLLTAHLDNGRIEYGETAIFVGPSHVITVRHGSTRGHHQVRERLEAGPSLLSQGTDYVLHAIIDFVVNGYIPIGSAIEDEVLKIEQRALDAFLNRAEILRLFSLRRQLIKFLRVLGPTSEVASKLVHLDLPCVDSDIRPYFSDVLDHIRRVEAQTAGLRDVLASVFEISTLLEQQRQGTITRQLAAWAAILAVPTAIAGIYGMNFQNMPELKTQYGYYVVLGVIATICVGLYAGFKRAKWL
jgi:magnesium transporter